jgi:hypothetical protein
MPPIPDPAAELRAGDALSERMRQEPSVFVAVMKSIGVGVTLSRAEMREANWSWYVYLTLS